MLWFLLAACTSTSEPPEILGVYPTFGYYRDETYLKVTGRNFYPTVTVDGRQANAGSIDEGLDLQLVGPQTRSLVAHLTGVQAMEAVVPSGLEPGTYDLVLTTAVGGETRAEDAFTVTAVRADHLRLETSSAAYDAGEVAEVSVQLVDSAEQPVEQSLQVQVVASSSAGNPSLRFEDGLAQQETTSDGVKGWLGEDGSGVFRVRSESPDDVRFDLSPLGNDSIDGASLLLSWSPGGLAGAELRWLGDQGTIYLDKVVAGTPLTLEVSLVDALGNVLLGETASVILFEQTSCGDWFETRTITGLEQVPVTLTTACDVDSIRVYVAGAIAETPSFEVLPAAAAAFNIVTPNSSVEAGVGLFPALIEAMDPYGNRVRDYEQNLTLTDSAGGLDTAQEVGSATCSSFVEGQSLCTAQLLKASEADQLTAVGTDGISGVSGSFAVTPSTPRRMSVEILQNRAAAAENFEVRVAKLDAWNNAVDYDPTVELATWADMTGSLVCEVDRPEADGSWIYRCSVTTAIMANVLSVELDALFGTSLGSIEITNGALGRVELTVNGPLTAGLAAPLRLTAWDAWNNPYLLQSDPVVDLTEASGTLTPGTATLDAAGTATLSISLTHATGSTTILASQGGVELGRSASFQVDPGPMSGLVLDMQDWIERGQSTTVAVSAVDAWNNLVTSFSGSGSISAQSGSCDPATIDSFVDGVAEVEISCPVAGLSEVLQVGVSSYSGASSPFDVVDFDCSPGATAALSLDGQSYLLQCLIGGSASVLADATNSSSSRAIVFYHYHDGQGNWERSTSSTRSYTYTDAGPRRVELVVVDADACGGTAEAIAWVGNDDGSPTGPISLTTVSSSVPNGSSTVVTAVAQDCTGDPPTGALTVWSDLGDPQLSATGSGFQGNLDSSGNLSFDWNFSAGYAGVATLYIGSENAFGETSLTVTGDAVRPQVIEVSPSGATADMSLLTVTFSEPMRAATMTSTEVQLNGPNGLVSLGLSLSADGQTLSITPPGDLPNAAYSLSLGLGLRDDAQGNRLDGAWSGVASAFTVDIGNLPGASPAVLACSLSSQQFTPDGDPGAGAEADQVDMSLVAASAPSWWWLKVTDSDENLIWSWRSDGSTAGLSWDGRSLDGNIVAPGSYKLEGRAVDSHGNIGDPCTQWVEVATHVQAP